MTRKFRGQEAVIEVDDGGTTVPVGILDEPEIVVSKDIQKLMGAGDIRWQDLQQTSVEVSVTGTIAEWDLDTWKTFVGYDEAADELLSDASVPTWTTTVIFTDTQGDTAEFTVQECYNEDVTLGGSREEWIGMDLDFTGQTVADVDANSTTAGSTA